MIYFSNSRCSQGVKVHAIVLCWQKYERFDIKTSQEIEKKLKNTFLTISWLQT